MTATPTPAPAPTPSPGSPDAAALARGHEATRSILARMPHNLDYITPEEILIILGLCYEYPVDFTQGLEPTGHSSETVANYPVPILTKSGLTFEDKPCRIRREIFLDNPAGTWIPDGNILWAHRILGQLRFRVREELEVIFGRRL